MPIEVPAGATGDSALGQEPLEHGHHQPVILLLRQARDRHRADQADAAHADREGAAVGRELVRVDQGTARPGSARAPGTRRPDRASCGRTGRRRRSCGGSSGRCRRMVPGRATWNSCWWTRVRSTVSGHAAGRARSTSVMPSANAVSLSKAASCSRSSCSSSVASRASSAVTGILLVRRLGGSAMRAAGLLLPLPGSVPQPTRRQRSGAAHAAEAFSPPARPARMRRHGGRSRGAGELSPPGR